MEDRRECSDKKIVSRCRERARRVYYGAVLDAKKEIPAKGVYGVGLLGAKTEIPVKYKSIEPAAARDART